MTVLKPYDFPELFRDFAFMPKFDDDIGRLSEMAEQEDWEYQNTCSDHSKPVLRNYFSYTYRRIAEEKKISITGNEEHACWNTGLITQEQEPIYAVFSKNNLSDATTYWHFSKYFRGGQRELNNFASLPEMAHF